MSSNLDNFPDRANAPSPGLGVDDHHDRARGHDEHRRIDDGGGGGGQRAGDGAADDVGEGADDRSAARPDQPAEDRRFPAIADEIDYGSLRKAPPLVTYGSRASRVGSSGAGRST